MREKDLNNYVYVCPHCMNKLKDCTCEYYPETLIQLDRKIWPAIRALNVKFYFTESCCEGHIGSNEMIHIFFKRKYKFKRDLPAGFHGDGSYICAKITGNTDLSKARSKNKLLKELYEWACGLPDMRPDGWRSGKEMPEG